MNDLERAALALQRGEVVAFPTETVYGLGAALFQPLAIERLFALKKRPSDNPLIVHISSLQQLDLVAHSIPPLFWPLAAAFFPGPLTILLPKNPEVPAIASSGLPTIGVRMPAHSLARALIDRVGEPLVAPSANLSGRPSSTTALHVREDFGDQVLILDGGPCQGGIESTVLTLEPRPTILRPGGITAEEIEKVIGIAVDYATEATERPLSPGLKYRHYAPHARVLVTDSYNSSLEQPRRLVVPHVTQATLYQVLRQADQEGKEEIVLVCDSQTRSDKALMNRIERASQ